MVATSLPQTPSQIETAAVPSTQIVAAKVVAAEVVAAEVVEAKTAQSLRHGPESAAADA